MVETSKKEVFGLDLANFKVFGCCGNPAKILDCFSIHATFMDFASNDHVSDDESQRLFEAFQIFWKQQKGIHQKATTNIPQKKIVEDSEDSEDELEEDSSVDDGGDGDDLYGARTPSNSVRRAQSNCVYIYHWNLANPRLKWHRCRGRHLQPFLAISKGACLLYRESKDS